LATAPTSNWTVPSFAGPPAIGRANLDGINLRQSFLRHDFGLDPDGIAVDNEGPHPQCVAPAVKGNTVRQATGAIRGADCSVGNVRKVFSSTVRRGRVISQKPRPGAIGPEGAKVKLTVSKGKRR
jgi:hypothetical protein